MQQMSTRDAADEYSGCSSCSQPSSMLLYLLLERRFGDLCSGLTPAFGFPCKEREEATKSMCKPSWVLPRAGGSGRMPGGSAGFLPRQGERPSSARSCSRDFVGWCCGWRSRRAARCSLSAGCSSASPECPESALSASGTGTALSPPGSLPIGELPREKTLSWSSRQPPQVPKCH